MLPTKRTLELSHMKGKMAYAGSCRWAFSARGEEHLDTEERMHRKFLKNRKD